MVSGRTITPGALSGAGRPAVPQGVGNVHAEGIKPGTVPDSGGAGGPPDCLVGSGRQSRRVLIDGSGGNGPANLDVPDGRQRTTTARPWIRAVVESKRTHHRVRAAAAQRRSSVDLGH